MVAWTLSDLHGFDDVAGRSHPSPGMPSLSMTPTISHDAGEVRDVRHPTMESANRTMITAARCWLAPGVSDGQPRPTD